MNWISIKSKKPDITQKVLILRQWYNERKVLCTSIDLAYYLNQPNQRHFKCFADVKSVEVAYLEVFNKEWIIHFPLDDSAPESSIQYNNITHWAELPEIHRLVKFQIQ